MVADIHDLAFLPKLRDNEDGSEPEKGFEIRIGGGTSIMPRIAWTLYDFVPVSEYLKVAEAAIRVFHRTDELRKNRMRARIKFYVDRIGIDAFREEVEEEMRGDWAQADFDPTPWMELPPEMIDEPPALVPVEAHDEPEFLAWREDNAHPQQQEGYYAVYVTLPLGDIYAHQFPVLADIGRKYAGGIRATTEQNILYRLGAGGPPVRRVGRAQGDRPRRGRRELHHGRRLLPRHRQLQDGHHLLDGRSRGAPEQHPQPRSGRPGIKGLHVKVSGCPNGCSRHHIANIGFHGAATKGDGNQVPAYEVFLAGNYGNQDPVRFGHRVKAKVPAKRVPAFMDGILAHYQSNRGGRRVVQRLRRPRWHRPVRGARRAVPRGRRSQQGEPRHLHRLGQDHPLQAGARRRRVRRLGHRTESTHPRAPLVGALPVICAQLLW